MEGPFHKNVVFFLEVIELSLKEQDLDNGLRIFEQKLQSKFPKVQAPVEKSEDDKEKKEIVEDKAAEEQKLEVKHILEHTLRLFAENLVNVTLKKNCSLLDLGIDRLVDLCIGLAIIDFIDPGTVFVILEDLFDTQTIDQCTQMFKVIEERANSFSNPIFHSKRARTALLRTCSEFLRRLSKSNNTATCGRILIFLASTFPLSDRSGVNLKSEHNLGNVTEFEEKKDSMEVDDIIQEPIDFNFYTQFWKLQSIFQNPQVLFTNSDKWNELTETLENVLNSFQSNSNFNDTEIQLEDDSFFAKYLTSSKLFQLELRDANFQRNTLIQTLIMFNTLQNPVQKSTSTSLKEKQKIWIQEMQVKVKELLENTPGGKIFTPIIFNILDRETNWVQWKRDGCKPFEKNPAKTSSKRKTNEITEKSNENKKIRMGNAELSRLWNLSLNDESLTRIHTPTLQEFIKPLSHEKETGGSELKGNKVYTWRALRLLSRYKLNQFQKIASGSIYDILNVVVDEKKEIKDEKNKEDVVDSKRSTVVESNDK